MRNRNLIISAVGDHSFHKEWISGEPDFDLVLIYYGNDDEIFTGYRKDALTAIRQKGQKFPLTGAFLQNNLALIEQYEYIWLPDDDISISTDRLNKLFKIAKEYDLSICQPSVMSANHEVSHLITSPVKNVKLRFTNFVEIMMPLFRTTTLLSLCDDFSLSESGWGLDASWSHRLNDPKNKIAIIDEISALHTRPVGSDYSRFRVHPQTELDYFLHKYNIRFYTQNYSFIFKDNLLKSRWIKNLIYLCRGKT
ncbi:MAG TPA: DUF707 domain-containing protein [Smithella sp.]|nr:DUF707 domain-containing protein [Smithella sp.]